ncbi:38258_t:CDS:2 [Gigaspora margarita]|uniref:38258_t:CDS:1 n=1 Tax=Gigaspora margarita TaxID=4874 RepID=A0ABN7ULD2_GIGMA|nr:38258_t:CDS:2 [Gigaspora margarita]
MWVSRYMILATLCSTIFDLEFWDLNFEMTFDQKEYAKTDPAAYLQLISMQEYHAITNIERL